MASLVNRTKVSTLGARRLNHHANIYHCDRYSRLGMLPPTQSRTNLGHISLSSYYTKQFSLPHHAHHIQPYPSSRWTGETLLVELSPIPAHPAHIPWKFPDRQITSLTTQPSNSPLPVNPPPTDLHTGSRRDSPPISTVRQRTLVSLFQHSQPLPFCKSQLTSPLHTS